MARIKQLSHHEAQKIAAGEVVERPANVVKELVENSLDAGSSTISIYIENAGKDLIRIQDNGSGMDKDDAYMSIKHHATSKISSVNDLASIATFGFRGEALSSISSVSKVILITKEEVGTSGIALTIYDSAVQKEAITAANRGTDISVADLFYNVPVRQKFLKTKETEWRAIVQLFHSFCFSYLPVHFKLYHENKLIYNCPPASDLLTRLGQLFDAQMVRSMLPFSKNFERMNIQVSGALSNTHYTKYDRNHIFLFVNNRWIKNYKLVQAFIKGYKNILQPNQYPVGFIFITIDPSFVDINIHPRKEEVQFLHPKIVEDYIAQTVQECLEQHAAEKLGSVSVLRQETPQVQHKTVPLSEPIGPLKISFSLNETDPQFAEQPEQKLAFMQILDQEFVTQKSVPFLEKPITANSIPSAAPSEQHIATEVEENKYVLIGQAMKTYIMIETADGITMIDLHAAHERIMYERFKKNFNTNAKIQLMFPQIITLSKDDVTSLTPYLYLFEPLGLTIEAISAQQIVIKETPIFLKNQSIEDILADLLALINQERATSQELNSLLQEKIHAQMSCKAAVKAGDILSNESMHEIIKELLICANRTTCPHGRPTLWQIAQHEIKKKFKRDYRS